MGLGLRKVDGTAVLLNFREPVETIQPSDAAGGLSDLVPPAGLGHPDVVDGWNGGKARQWGANDGYQATDAVSDATRITRDASVEIIFSTADRTATKTLYQRGKGDGTAAERVTLGVRWTATQKIEVYWTKVGGAGEAIAQFDAPATQDNIDGWMHVVVTRRWISGSKIEVDLFSRGRKPAATITVTDDIDPAVSGSGTTLVGCKWGGAAIVEDMASGDRIAALRVFGREVTQEEATQSYLEQFEYPLRGHELARALQPPGQSYSRDPGSLVQRDLAEEGDAHGLAMALVGDLVDNFPPDRAYGPILERWEKVTRLAARPGDLVSTRRVRVLTHLRKVHGYNIDEIQIALAEILGYAGSPQSVEIIERSNTYLNAFGAAIGNDWLVDLAPGVVGSAAASGGQLVLTFTSGDGSWQTPAGRRALCARTPVLDPTEIEVIAKLNASTLEVDGADFAGVVHLDPISEDAHFFGLSVDGGASVLKEILARAGVISTAAITPAPAGAPSGVWLRMQRTAAGAMNLYWSTTGDNGPWTQCGTNRTSTIAAPSWAGAAVVTGTSGPSVGTITAEFDDLKIWTPKGTHVFEWYVYRNPGNPGVYDVLGAQLTIEKMKPAHTRGTVVESKILLCDHAQNLCDRDPLG